MQGEAEFPDLCSGSKATDNSEVFPLALLALRLDSGLCLARLDHMLGLRQKRSPAGAQTTVSPCFTTTKKKNSWAIEHIKFFLNFSFLTSCLYRKLFLAFFVSHRIERLLQVQLTEIDHLTSSNLPCEANNILVLHLNAIFKAA